jgi:polyphosphate glucokinase
MVTFGTGIGSALFIDGELVPNTELGHLPMGKHDAEHIASEIVREEQDLSWKEWSKRVEEYLLLVERLFTPDLFIIGGGISKKADKFVPRLDKVQTEIVPAQLLNEAGIVGAALVHAHRAGVPHTD